APGFQPSRATALLVVLFLVACGEAAGSGCANTETSPSPAGQPSKKGEGKGAKDDQRQREREAALQAFGKSTSIVVCVNARGSIRQRLLAITAAGCLQPAAVFVVLRTGVIYRA